MSSDLFVVFDGSSSSLFQNSSSDEILSPETEFFFGDHDLSPFSDSAVDILQALSDHQIPAANHQTLAQTQSQFQTLNLHQTASELPIAFGDLFHESLAVKTEECHVALYNNNNNNYNCAQSQSLVFDSPSFNGGAENVASRLIQRSLSSNSFEQKPCSSSSSSGPLFSPRFDSLIESQPLRSPENGFMRKVCSTGDLQSFGTVRNTQRSLSSPLMEESNFKVGKYSAEERKEKISKYRAKRTLRNFNKTIKYACRKTLADNRPRVRGRFARNDEPIIFDVPKAHFSSSSRPEEDEDDELWLERLHEEEEGIDQTVRGQFVNSYGSTQFQYYGF